MPPCILELNWVPSMSTLDISAVAKMSGIQLTASQMNMINNGRTRAPSTESLNVWTQRNVTAGAASIFSLDQYPVAPEIAHPTAKPKMIDADFMSGEPNCSTIMTVTKTLNPRPMSFGSPLWHGTLADDNKNCQPKEDLPRQRLWRASIRA